MKSYVVTGLTQVLMEAVFNGCSGSAGKILRVSATLAIIRDIGHNLHVTIATLQLGCTKAVRVLINPSSIPAPIINNVATFIMGH